MSLNLVNGFCGLQTYTQAVNGPVMAVSRGRRQFRLSPSLTTGSTNLCDNKNDLTHHLFRVVTPLVTECFQRFPRGLVFPGKPLRKPKTEFKYRLYCQTENMHLLELFAFLCFISSVENLNCTHGCFCVQTYARCPDLASATKLSQIVKSTIAHLTLNRFQFRDIELEGFTGLLSFQGRKVVRKRGASLPCDPSQRPGQGQLPTGTRVSFSSRAGRPAGRQLCILWGLFYFVYFISRF